MNLYQIDREILSCVDQETGEIIDFEQLDALQMDRERKIENLACYIKNLKAEEAAFSAEKRRSPIGRTQRKQRGKDWKIIFSDI